jgi:biopolymer transport protein ExbD
MGGVQEAPGKGGKKSLNVELNLVPFIDLMTVCVTFLLLTAVWTQTSRISIDQAVAKPQKQEQKEPPKKMIVMVDRNGYVVKWSDEQPEKIPMAGGKYNTDALREKMKSLQEKLPKDQKIMVAPEDSVRYDDMIGAMDVLSQLGLTNMMVADAASVAGEVM